MSTSTEPARRTRAVSLGKMPTTRQRRLSSMFNRSSGFVDDITNTPRITPMASYVVDLGSPQSPPLGGTPTGWTQPAARWGLDQVTVKVIVLVTEPSWEVTTILPVVALTGTVTFSSVLVSLLIVAFAPLNVTLIALSRL